jgi:hypothetical protein
MLAVRPKRQRTIGIAAVALLMGVVLAACGSSTPASTSTTSSSSTSSSTIAPSGNSGATGHSGSSGTSGATGHTGSTGNTNPNGNTGPPTPNPLPLAPISTLGPLASPGALGPIGPEGVPMPTPLLAGTQNAATGQTVDGIKCNTAEQLVYHIHVHLTIFVDGKARGIPYGIGIPGAQTQATAQGPFVVEGNCFYWLHTHSADGILHVESPTQRTYTLGNFFNLWGQPLSPTQLGPEQGTVVALYNGRVWTGNPRSIPLNRHAQIQLMIGTPLVSPVQVTFPSGL